MMAVAEGKLNCHLTKSAKLDCGAQLVERVLRQLPNQNYCLLLKLGVLVEECFQPRPIRTSFLLLCSKRSQRRMWEALRLCSVPPVHRVSSQLPLQSFSTPSLLSFAPFPSSSPPLLFHRLERDGEMPCPAPELCDGEHMNLYARRIELRSQTACRRARNKKDEVSAILQRLWQPSGQQTPVHNDVQIHRQDDEFKGR